jgi:hypothetical protein
VVSVFLPARSFQKNEFITCYLGELTDDSEGSYVFKKINGLSLSMGNVDNYGNCWNCLGKPLLVSDHWFAHRIQHGSGGKVNVKISERYVISSLRKITDGEDIFMDYNRDCKCMKYDVWCKYSFPPFLYNHFCSKCGKESNLCKPIRSTFSLELSLWALLRSVVWSSSSISLIMLSKELLESTS